MLAEKRDEIASCGSRGTNIVPGGPHRKLAWLESAAGDAAAGPAGRGIPGRAGSHTHDWLHMTSKYEKPIFDSHRQIRGLVYNSLSGSN